MSKTYGSVQEMLAVTDSENNPLNTAFGSLRDKPLTEPEEEEGKQDGEGPLRARCTFRTGSEVPRSSVRNVRSAAKRQHIRQYRRFVRPV